MRFFFISARNFVNTLRAYVPCSYLMYTRFSCLGEILKHHHFVYPTTSIRTHILHIHRPVVFGILFEYLIFNTIFWLIFISVLFLKGKKYFFFILFQFLLDFFFFLMLLGSLKRSRKLLKTNRVGIFGINSYIFNHKHPMY